MRRLALAIALVSTAALSFGQGPADVPPNHWASDAVANLYRLGILTGYPDRDFRGTRPVSRYEMAHAIYGLYSNQLVEQNRLKAAIEDLERDVRRPATPQDIEGLAAIRLRLDSLEGDVAQLQTLRPEIDDLEKRFQSMTEELRRIRESIRTSRGG